MAWNWELNEATNSCLNWNTFWPHLSTEEKFLLQTSTETVFQPDTQPTKEQLTLVLRSSAHAAGWILHPRQEKILTTVLYETLMGGGPLTPLLTHPCVEEIAITGIGNQHPVRIYEIKKGWTDTPLYFTDETYVITLFNRLSRESGTRLSGETPILNARINGGMRIHASIPPICQTPIEASIRRFTHRPTHPIQLLPSRIWSPEIIAYLETALACDANVLIAGNTGSGKTTTLNALAHLFPTSERIVTIEETQELSLTHPHRVSMFPKTNTSFDMARLIRETLRMRPDRVIVGEIRFPEEARAYMESILAGQGKGTYATFHGHSSLETLARLKQYGISENDLGWINILLIQRRWTQEQKHAQQGVVRKVTEVVELEYLPERGLQLHPVFTYDPTSDDWIANPSEWVASRFPHHFPHSSFAEHVYKRTNEIAHGGKNDFRPHPEIQTQTNRSRMGSRS